MEPKRFEYYAFISYSHLDEKWAKWLQRKLENYSLPSSIRKEYGERIPKNIRPIFRDQTDLGIGNLQQSLSRELEDSRFLIVICSPSSAKSEWVNKEIRHFKELGRSDRVIPFIVSGHPDSTNPDEHCYPPALKENNSQLLGASLKELLPEQALIKVIAAMLGVKYDILYDRHRRRQKRNRIIISTTVCILLFTLGALSFMLIDYYSVKYGKSRPAVSKEEVYIDQFSDLNIGLRAAARDGNSKLLKLFLEKGADPNKKMSGLKLPIEEAISCGSLECVKLLLDNRADPNSRNNNGGSVIQGAFSKQDDKIVKILLDKGLNLNEKAWSDSEDVATIAERAYEGGFLSGEIYALIIEHLDPKSTNFTNILALYLFKGFPEKDLQILEMIISKGADPSSRIDFHSNRQSLSQDDNNYLLLDLYIHKMNSDPHILNVLLKNIPSEKKDFLLSDSIGKRMFDSKIISVLVENGADVNKKDKDGNTPLISAIKGPSAQDVFSYQIDNVKILLEKNPDILAKNNEGKDAIDIAKTKKNKQIINILEKKIKSK